STTNIGDHPMPKDSVAPNAPNRKPQAKKQANQEKAALRQARISFENRLWAKDIFKPKDRVRCMMDSLSFYSGGGSMSATRETLASRCGVSVGIVSEVQREDIGKFYERQKNGAPLIRVTKDDDPKTNREIFEEQRLSILGVAAGMVRIILRMMT